MYLLIEIMKLAHTYPIVDRRSSCHCNPKGKTGHDHQYHGFSHGILGKVITLLGPQGTFHRSFKSTYQKGEMSVQYNENIDKILRSITKS